MGGIWEGGGCRGRERKKRRKCPTSSKCIFIFTQKSRSAVFRDSKVVVKNCNVKVNVQKKS